jgi:hypothetical protein
MFATQTRAPGSAPLHPTRQQLDELDALLQRMLSLPVEEGDEPARADMAAAPPPPPGPAVEPEAKRVAGAQEPSPTPDYSSWLPHASAAASSPTRAYPASYMVVETVGPAMAPPEPEQHLAPSEISSPEAGSDEGGPLLAVSPPVPSAAEEPPAEEWVPLRSSWQPSPHTWGPLADSWQQARAAGAAPAEIIPPAPETVPADHRSEPADDPPPVFAPIPHSPAPAHLATPWWLTPAVLFNKLFDLFLLPLGPMGRWLRGRAGRALLGTLGLGSLLAALALALADTFGWTW